MKRFTPEQIVKKLRQADVELGKGLTVKEVCRKIEVTDQIYYPGFPYHIHKAAERRPDCP